MKKLAISLTAAVLFTFFISAYSEKIENNLADNVIRLHITAQSDSEYDQAVKLKVRDRIIKEMSPALSGAENIDESKKIILENMDRIKVYAEDELRQNGAEYGARCFLGEYDFPVKTYQNIIFPPGKYTALRIVLGDGEGQNWWCVMYPPLCFVDGSAVISDESRDILKENLDSDTYDIITQSGECPDIKIKFKIVEIFQNIGKEK